MHQFLDEYIIFTNALGCHWKCGCTAISYKIATTLEHHFAAEPFELITCLERSDQFVQLLHHMVIDVTIFFEYFQLFQHRNDFTDGQHSTMPLIHIDRCGFLE